MGSGSTDAPNGPTLRGERVLLRRWRPADLDPFAEMNRDPEVMEFFPSTLTRAETAGMIGRIERCFRENGYGLWAVELPGEAPFAGFVGLNPVGMSVHFAPAVEVGWRLGRPFWGRGIATESAVLSLRHGFLELGLREIVSFTAACNVRSQRVMERIGMTRERVDDFTHPAVAPGHPLAAHVLYRISRRRFAAGLMRERGGPLLR